jgi:factor associated with neutral sphingomyelinase activation
VCSQAWLAGRLSNFDYLMVLNRAAGRSYNDLAQWPVMPWVIADWRSPSLDLADPRVYRDLRFPVGALNPAR